MNVSNRDEEENWDDKSETSSGHSTSHEQPTEKKEADEPLAKEETKQIWIWKQLVIVLIIATAAAVSAGTYKFLKDEEDNDFHDSVRMRQVVEPIRHLSPNDSQLLRSLSRIHTV